MFLNTVNTFSLVVIFLFGFYHIHVTDKRLMKTAYAIMAFAAALMLLFAFIPTDSPYYNRTVLWQPVLLRIGIAFYCLARFFTYEVNTTRFKQAFINNNRKTLIEIEKE